MSSTHLLRINIKCSDRILKDESYRYLPGPPEFIDFKLTKRNNKYDLIGIPEKHLNMVLDLLNSKYITKIESIEWINPDDN